MTKIPFSSFLLFPYTVLNVFLDLLTFGRYQGVLVAFTQYHIDTISEFAIPESVKNFPEECRYLTQGIFSKFTSRYFDTFDEISY